MTTPVRADARHLFKGVIPAPAGLGIIKALEKLGVVLKQEQIPMIQFDAGLPCHDRPQNVKDELGNYAEKDQAPYSRYPYGEAICEDDVLPEAARFHEAVTGIHTEPDRLVLTEGSTPALNHMIRMFPMEKARKDGKRLGEGCALETFELSYPLYDLPANEAGMYTKEDPRYTPGGGEITKMIKLNTEIEVGDGFAIKSKSWKLNRQSLIDSFTANRDRATTMVYSNPANPTGYALSEAEEDFVAGELLKDFQYRKAHGVPAKLVIEDIAYITMMADDNYKPYLLVHAFDKMIREEEAKAQPDKEKLQQMHECKETVVTTHSLSKAAAVAGDRVAYTEANPAIVNALRESYTREMLSYSNAGLHAALGALAAGKPDRTVMKEYSERSKYLEEGINNAYFKTVAEADPKLDFTEEQLRTTMPFPNKADGSFFTVMNLKPLLGQKVDPEFVDKVKSYIAKIPNEGLRNSFGEVFANGVINEKDLPLYFLFKTLEHGGAAVSTVGLKDATIRFSTGVTDLPDVERAVKATEAFFKNDPAYLNGVKEFMQKVPTTTVDTHYTIDVSHLAEKGAIARAVWA